MDLGKDLVAAFNDGYKQGQADAMEYKYTPLKKEFDTCRNELCLRCGSYKQAHNGACDWCRWRKTYE